MLLAVLLAGSASAQSWDLAGSSMRDVAMAGAGAAGDLPGAALAVDPASIAGIDGEVAEFSWRGSFPSVRTSDDEDLVTDAVHALGVSMGVARPLGEKTAISAGFQWYLPLPNSVSTLVRMNPDDPQAPLLDDATDFTSLDLAVAVKASKIEVALGVALGLHMFADTDIRLLSLAGEERGDRLDLTGSVGMDARRDLRWIGAPLVGVHYRTEDGNAFVSWRGQTGFKTSGDQTLEIEIQLIEIDPVRIPVTYLSAWSPARLTVGGNWVFGAFQPELVLRYIVGSGFADTQYRDPEEAFHDVLSPAAGLQFDIVGGLAARTGYALVPTVVPPQTGETHFADATRHVLGLGGALTLQDAPRSGDVSQLVVATQLQILPERSTGFSAKGSWFTTNVGVQTNF